MQAPRIPILNEVIASVTTTFNNAMPTINLNEGNIIINSYLRALAGVTFDHSILLNTYYNDSRISTASPDALLSYGLDMGVSKQIAKAASGFVMVDASLEEYSHISELPSSTSFLIDTNIYFSQGKSSKFISSLIVEYASYSSVSNTTEIVIKGYSDRNKVFAGLILVNNDNKEKYPILKMTSITTFLISGDKTKELPEMKELHFSYFKVLVNSKDLGLANNVAGGTKATTDFMPNATVVVEEKGIKGGVVGETDDNYRSRLIQAKSSLNKGVYGNDGLRRLLLENSLDYQFLLLRSSKELVRAPGFSTIYLLHKNNGPLAQSELNNLLDLLFTYNGGLIYPNEAKEDKRTLVLNANIKPQNFTITNLNPDYSSVRLAIINSLKDFFLTEVTIGKSISYGEYYRAIARAVDDIGNRVISFKISNPTGDITCNLNDRIIFGEVTFG